MAMKLPGCLYNKKESAIKVGSFLGFQTILILIKVGELSGRNRRLRTNSW